MLMQITTQRLELSAWTSADRPAMEALCTDTDVMRYIGNGKAMSRSELDVALQQTIDHYHHGFGELAMRSRGCPDIIGECGLKLLEDGPDVEIGWMLMPRYWGCGLATEAARAALHWGLASLQLDEIVAVADEQNHASLKIIDKLGMQFVGYARHYGSRLRKYSVTRQGCAAGRASTSSA